MQSSSESLPLADASPGRVHRPYLCVGHGQHPHPLGPAGAFLHLGTLLTIFWVFEGDALAGSTLSGYVGTLGIASSFLFLPVVNWGCRRLQKHRALRMALLWMSLGTLLNWFFIRPEQPYLQLVLPIFFSVGISSVFTILPTMMADVTDIDELSTGVRREGMFGAVMSLLMEMIGTLTPIAAEVVLVATGFDASLGANQEPETFVRLRVVLSFVPTVIILSALLVLWRYPLTRERMEAVKKELAICRAAAAA